MTICIAGISENNKIIAITDKMVTFNNPSMKTIYEINENNKAIKINNKTVALFAGDVIAGNTILELAKTELNRTKKNVPEAAKIIQTSYRQYWNKVISENLLNRYGLNLETFMNIQPRLEPKLVSDINKILGEYNLGVEIIVAGIDKNPHILLINNPGTITSVDSMGYASIGSGSQHANLSLIENKYNSQMEFHSSLFSLLEAKKRAEYDPGVGELCDIVIIDTTYHKLNPETVSAILDKLKQSESATTKIKKRFSTKIFDIVKNNHAVSKRPKK